jgi:O-acetyl-ADP-ribose deacetylase (regulator of RNase III)
VDFYSKPLGKVFLADNATVRAAFCDITTVKADAIVNFSSWSLLEGGEVFGAIHRTAGAELLRECRRFNGCGTGEARRTPGFKLPAEFVIHTVAPIWRGGRQGEARMLASCFEQSLEAAVACRARTIAFPTLSHEIESYPPHLSIAVGIDAVADWCAKSAANIDVLFCCTSRSELGLYNQLLTQRFL